MIKTVGLLTRKSGWTHEQFMKHWVGTHAPLAHKVPGLRRYVQNHIHGERTRTDIEATAVEGRILADACRWYAFRTCAINDAEPRTCIEAEVVAARYRISREAQDAFGLESQRRTAAAQQGGRFAEEIVPVETEMVVTDKATGATRKEKVTLSFSTRAVAS